MCQRCAGKITLEPASSALGLLAKTIKDHRFEPVSRKSLVKFDLRYQVCTIIIPSLPSLDSQTNTAGSIVTTNEIQVTIRHS